MHSPGHCLVVALTIAGSGEEARAAANGLIDAAEATHNPLCALVRAFRLRLRLPRRRSRPRAGGPAPGPGDRPRQRQPLRRITSGDSSVPPRGRTRRPAGRARLRHSGDPQLPRLGQHHHIRVPLAILAAFFDRLGRLRTGGHHRRFRVQSPHRSGGSPSSTPRSPTSAMSSATQTYESLARKGETMTTAAMVTYAYDQIDQARAELNAVSK